MIHLSIPWNSRHGHEDFCQTEWLCIKLSPKYHPINESTKLGFKSDRQQEILKDPMYEYPTKTREISSNIQSAMQGHTHNLYGKESE